MILIIIINCISSDIDITAITITIIIFVINTIYIAYPVIWRLSDSRASSFTGMPDIVVAESIVFIVVLTTFNKPGVLVTGVVRYEVQDQTHV